MARGLNYDDDSGGGTQWTSASIDRLLTTDVGAAGAAWSATALADSPTMRMTDPSGKTFSQYRVDDDLPPNRTGGDVTVWVLVTADSDVTTGTLQLRLDAGPVADGAALTDETGTTATLDTSVNPITDREWQKWTIGTISESDLASAVGVDLAFSHITGSTITTTLYFKVGYTYTGLHAA